MSENIKIEISSNDSNHIVINNSIQREQEIISLINQNNILCVFIDEDNFISNDAKKIFLNIVLNSYEFIPGLISNQQQDFSKNGLSYQINSQNMELEELLNSFDIFLKIIEKANIISNLIINNFNKEYTNPTFLPKYKSLIEGIKTSYEKGLILIKMLCNNQFNEEILSKYYRLIQGREQSTIRKELFSDLLSCNCQIENNIDSLRYVKKTCLKYKG